jgi:hypothetical protein
MKVCDFTIGCRTVLPLLVTLLCCSFPSESPSQEPNPKEDQFASLRYYGTNGLSKSAPQDTAILEYVEIVYGTKLTKEDVDFLSTLEPVEELSMGGNLNDEFVTIEGSLAPLAKMKNLKRVFLCKGDMRDEDLEFVGKLPVIESLEFVGNTDPRGTIGPGITDECAEHLRRATALRELCILYGDRLTDQFVSVISRDLKNLEHLDIDSELLTDRSLQMLADRCSNLRWIDMYSDHFTDEGVGYLANAKKMEMLWLGSNSLTHNCVKSVSGLIHLQHLELTVPTITDEGVQALAGLPALEILALRKPPFSDEQFALFANHPTLQSAFLNGRDLSTTKVMDVIKTIPKLNHLGVGMNPALQSSVDQFLASRKAGP